MKRKKILFLAFLLLLINIGVFVARLLCDFSREMDLALSTLTLVLSVLNAGILYKI